MFMKCVLSCQHSHHIYTLISFAAHILGCDTVYSTTDQEYILLNPHFVLPEFIMCLEMQPPAGTRFAMLR